VLATVQRIDESSAGQILSKRTIIVGNLLVFIPVVLMFIGLGIAAAAAYWGIDEHGNQDWVDRIPAILFIALGLILAGVSAYWGLRNNTKVGNWYIQRLARKVIGARSDRIVDPDDPEAIFVEIVPRRNWERLMLETATDIGYLVFDESSREVLFEGDHERLRIPVSAIEVCEVERVMAGGDMPGAIEHYMTVIDVEFERGMREIPFAFRGDFGSLGAATRERRAADYRDRILDLME
jgi:hypothetical protein